MILHLVILFILNRLLGDPLMAMLQSTNPAMITGLLYFIIDTGIFIIMFLIYAGILKATNLYPTYGLDKKTPRQ